mgnify:CR=1 FL=1
MTQEATPVGGEAAPAPETPQQYFENMAVEEFGIQDEEEQPAETEGEEPTGEADDDLQLEEEADDLPPIDAPVSWDAEAKAKFAELPRELQETVAKRETERERFVQQKSQEAKQAQQSALQQAQSELAQINAAYAEQLQHIAQSVTVQEPDPMLQVTDPVAYAQQMRAARQADAQRSQAQQQAQHHAQQAQALAMQAAQAEQAEQHRYIVENFPEYADPTTGPELRSKLTAVAKEMGYPDELIGQARAQDILAIRKASDWKAKAEKYDSLMSKKMANVRAARGKPPVQTRPGVAQGSDAVRARSAQAAFETAKSSHNRDVQGAAFYDYLKNSGHI